MREFGTTKLLDEIEKCAQLEDISHKSSISRLPSAPAKAHIHRRPQAAPVTSHACRPRFGVSPRKGDRYDNECQVPRPRPAASRVACPALTPECWACSAPSPHAFPGARRRIPSATTK